MDDESSKLFKFLSEKEVFKSTDIPPSAKIISINIDIGSLNISDNLEDYNIKNMVIKKTNKVIFLKTIITDIKKNKNITFSHEPLNLADNKSLNICGHYHPKLYLKNNGDKLSLRCFAMDTKKNNLYLPAFGDLTGGYLCKKSFKKWAIISEEEIIEI